MQMWPPPFGELESLPSMQSTGPEVRTERIEAVARRGQEEDRARDHDQHFKGEPPRNQNGLIQKRVLPKHNAQESK